MQCRNELCTNKATGRSQYCSPKCRIACHRAKLAELRIQSVTDETEKSVTDESVTQTVTSSLKHYYDNPEMYAPRTNPDKLNWGAWLNAEGLADAGCNANRVIMPGDHDYVQAASHTP